LPTDLKMDGPHRLDIAIGQRIRERRRAIGMSQQDLAEVLRITFQQVQKYERGANRISFSRLVEIADAMQCRLNDLTEGLDQNRSTQELDHLNALLRQDGALEILEAFAAIRSAGLRRTLIAHARALRDVEESADS
jgi:transcriptional regulator with XRE-family HTH domain